MLVVSTNSLLDDRENHLNTLFCHILSLLPLCLSLSCCSASGVVRSLESWLCIFNDSAWVLFMWQTGCSLLPYSAIHTFLHFNSDSRHLGNGLIKMPTSSKSSRFLSVVASHGAAFPLTFCYGSCVCVERQMQLLIERKSSTPGGQGSRGRGVRVLGCYFNTGSGVEVLCDRHVIENVIIFPAL